MKFLQLAAKLKAMSVHRELPIRIYDFTDIFQIPQIAVNRLSYFLDNSLVPSIFTYELVADSQTQEVTVGEFVDSLTVLADTYYSKDSDTVVLLPDGTRNTLGGLDFDQRNQSYVITLGTEILKAESTVLEKYIFNLANVSPRLASASKNGR